MWYLENWAERELNSDSEIDIQLSEILFGLSSDKAHDISLKLAEERNEFVPESEEGQKMAITILNEYCQKFLNKEISPFRLCLLVQSLNGIFVSYKKIDDNTFEYPVLLVNL